MMARTKALISLLILGSVLLNACADKLFLTDIDDSAIYVAENTGSNFFSSSFRQLDLTGVEDPIGVDYDYRNDMVYWTDEGRRAISRAKLDGSLQETLVQDFQGVGYPEGIVLDLEDDKMIWTDTLLETIESANLDGSSRRNIINTGLYLPWSITISQKRKMLYWTEHGDSVYVDAKIEMSNKYGIGRRAIVSTRILQPNSLALDSQEERLYWTDGYYDTIESIDLDTYSDRQQHVYTVTGDPLIFGISLYFHSIYFTEIGNSALYEAELGATGVREVSVHALPVHVKIYADLTCPDPDQCTGHSTCELIAYQTPSCTCLPGYTGATCEEALTCSEPYDTNDETHYEDPRATYYHDEILDEVCDNGYDKRTWYCNGYTGDWYTHVNIDCDLPPNSGLSQGAVIGISCTLGIIVVIGGLILCKTYNKSRRPNPPVARNAANPPVFIVNYGGPEAGAQIQGGGPSSGTFPPHTYPPGGATGWTPSAPPIPTKEQQHQQAWQEPPEEMPPPGYSTIA